MHIEVLQAIQRKIQCHFFRKALELRATGIELDLQKTKDRKIVIFHDITIDKKSNNKGKISDYTYNELKEMDFGSWFGKEYKNERSVLFEDFAKEFLNKDLTFAKELKDMGIDLIICSSMKGPRHTTEILNVNSLPIIYLDSKKIVK